MMKKTLAAALALLLCLSLMLGSMGVLAESDKVETEVVEAEPEKIEDEVPEDDGDVVFSAPIEEIVEESLDKEVWTEEIAKDVAASEEAEALAEEAARRRIADSVKIAKATFPDAAFRAYIEDEFDDDYDGYLSSSEIAAVTEIDCESSGVTSIAGVEVFVNLEVLDVRYNEIKNVDVSYLTHLRRLVLWGNQVTKLNVTGCTALEYLDVDDNQLTTLTAKKLPYLQTIWARNNGLSTIDVSGDTSLSFDGLHISNNDVLSLNISGCTSITQLDVTASELQLKGVDVSNNPNMTRLGVRDNQLKTLNIKNCPALTYVSVYDNYLTELDFGGCDQIKCAVDAGGTIDSDGDLCFSSCGSAYMYIDDGVSLKYNGGNYRYMVDGEYRGGVKPRTIKFKKKSLSLKMGKTLNLAKYVKLTPSTAATTFTWKSKNPKIAKVSEDGVVTPLKPGTAKIVVKADNGGKTASIKIKITAVKPTKVTVSAERKTIYVGETVNLSAVLKPSNAYSAIKWTSKNPKIASVSSSGVVKGKKAGTAKIVAKATNGGKTGSIKIKVKKASANPVKYRALIIAQVNYYGGNALPLCENDGNLMVQTLQRCKGGEGGSWQITKKQDQTYSEFMSAIDSAFAGADENDVSLLYYTGHGSSDGSLCAWPYCDLISQSAIASKLQSIPGKIFVMYDSCHSGSGIYEYGEENGPSGFDAAVIKAFSAADTGIWVDEKGNGVTDLEANTGELRVANKFYVLTAARKDEYSWCVGAFNCSAFTKWASDGIGSSGHMPADTNYDNVATLNEMFNYISDIGDDQTFSGYHQHVQVYPRNSSFKAFSR